MSQHQRDKQAYLNATPMQREVVRRLLCDVLACLRAQYLSYQTSHWQVVGQSFYGNHLLFQRLYESVQGQVDGLAEKIVGYLGRQIVGLEYQMKHVWGYTQRWSQIGCHHKRGLQSEMDLQASLKRAYDGIKQVNAMTLGLDDWIMATANAHEENEYLLQQALTPVPGQKRASKPTPPFGGSADETLLDQKGDRFLWLVKRPTMRGKTKREWMITDSSGQMVFIDGRMAGYGRKRDAMGAWETVQVGKQASGAPSAEGDFYDNPEKKEVLEFAQTGAISNSPEVAAAASQEEQLDVPEKEAVAEAEEAPPTPTEIADEPGGKAVSTLNRLVIDSEDPDAEKAAKANVSRMAAWMMEIENG